MRIATLLFVASLSLCHAQTINYTYDDAGRLIHVSYASGKTIDYTYDNAGNLLSRVVTTPSPAPAPAAAAKNPDRNKSDRRSSKPSRRDVARR
jgi:YD repeat-containing protein